MDKKINIFEDVTKDIINKFFKKEELKKEYFSFFNDENEYNQEDTRDLSPKLNKYYNFDDIDSKIFHYIMTMMIKQYEFSIDLIKKYTLIVKNIEIFDIDILNLIFKSIQLQFEILKYKNNKDYYNNTDELEEFAVKNLYFNIEDYIKLINNYYTHNDYKPILINIFVMIYNYSLFYSIENMKKITFIKN